MGSSEILTDPARIAALLEDVIPSDPVRHTLLGTIAEALRRQRDPGSWAWVDPARPANLAARSESGYPVAVVGEWPDEHRAPLVRALAALPDLAAITAADGLAQRLAAEVGALRPAASPTQRVVSLRLFRCDVLQDPTAVPGYGRTAGPADRELLLRWIHDFLVFVEEPVSRAEAIVSGALTGPSTAHLWQVDGADVAVAFARPVISGSARIGPVFTPSEQRGHGFAAAVTARATRSILDEGAVPVLFTDLANPTSNGVYRRLGYTAVMDLAEVDLV